MNEKLFFKNVLMQNISQESKKVLISMIESPFDFFKLELEVLLGGSKVRLEPMFYIGLESFNAVKVA